MSAKPQSPWLDDWLDLRLVDAPAEEIVAAGANGEFEAEGRLVVEHKTQVFGFSGCPTHDIGLRSICREWWHDVDHGVRFLQGAILQKSLDSRTETFTRIRVKRVDVIRLWGPDAIPGARPAAAPIAAPAPVLIASKAALAVRRAGAPTAADWAELEVALEREIEKVGPPHKGAEKGWRTKADVARWIVVRTGDDEPGPSALKENVTKMLNRIRAKRKTAGKSETWL